MGKQIQKEKPKPSKPGDDETPWWQKQPNPATGR